MNKGKKQEDYLRVCPKFFSARKINETKIWKTVKLLWSSKSFRQFADEKQVIDLDMRFWMEAKNELS